MSTVMAEQPVRHAEPADTAPLDARHLGRLKWSCRRGLLENDLFLERFFARHEACLTIGQARGLSALLELSDTDLLDLNLGRKTPAQLDPGLDRADVREVLNMLRANR